MKRFVLRRMLRMIPVLLLVSLAVAFMLDLAPGDPAITILGDQATPEQIAQVHERLGLDKAPLSRYWDWLSGAVQGDLGSSFTTHQSVSEIITTRLPVTAEMVVLAMLIALMVSIPIGMYTAYRSDRWFDRVWSVGSSTLISVPPFVSALVLVYALSLRLGLLPATGWSGLSDGLPDNLRYIILPALTLALLEIPVYTRLLRADLIATLQQEFVLAARSKGIPTRRVLFRHALRPSSISLLTVAGLSFGRLLGGAVVVEYLFSIPGLGQALVLNIQGKDVVVVQGLVTFVAVVYVLLNALIDVLYGVLDPRVRARVAGVR